MCHYTKYKASKPHFSNVYDNRKLLKNKFILKFTNYFETNIATTKIVPRINCKKGYSYHVSINTRYLGVVKTIEVHSLSCLHSVIKYLFKMY